MPQSTNINRRITLASRPNGAPGPENFRLEQVEVPEIEEGQVLLRTLYLSLDPYMRGRMDEGPSYAEPVPVGGVMGAGTISRVEKSHHSGFKEGELVLAYAGWQDYAVSDGKELIKLDPTMEQPSYALGVLGMPGMTAYFGLLDIGQPQPGETVAVAAATGAVGSVVGQIAKLKGCRVVGIAGGPEKCRHAVEELGFDACIDHRDADFKHKLADACPEGIDVYFENVGGKVFEAVLPRLNPRARVPLCGLIANYNMTELPPGPDRSSQLLLTILIRRLKIQGFIITLDYGHRAPEFLADMTLWLRQGRIRYREDVVEGLENAPDAFMGLLEGKNFGKLVVKVADA